VPHFCPVPGNRDNLLNSLFHVRGQPLGHLSTRKNVAVRLLNRFSCNFSKSRRQIEPAFSSFESDHPPAFTQARRSVQSPSGSSAFRADVLFAQTSNRKERAGSLQTLLLRLGFLDPKIFWVALYLSKGCAIVAATVQIRIGPCPDQKRTMPYGKPPAKLGQAWSSFGLAQKLLAEIEGDFVARAKVRKDHGAARSLTYQINSAITERYPCAPAHSARS